MKPCEVVSSSSIYLFHSPFSKDVVACTFYALWLPTFSSVIFWIYGGMSVPDSAFSPFLHLSLSIILRTHTNRYRRALSGMGLNGKSDLVS
ncbi:uncharacterized protein BP01DRAFT_240917 [Aspergillus saccharolyticus JOP 1030-1]|uniref:Uncharacterized protein n=1 Tax=Aspergillus saccharolyticus JOP 1030-1 TaxID=1450539 RepID=A0A318ZRF2_9EURO|nr:hypothetical protein BP01DRAFT_240917 [Aspergillus saccharolyticus JOP 1030-1]PYH46943.1 hypothetical protein BP01DRAFT_240917 [Aspergillus saccharolyticus JOP 1030-1]